MARKIQYSDEALAALRMSETPHTMQCAFCKYVAHDAHLYELVASSADKVDKDDYRVIADNTESSARIWILTAPRGVTIA